MMLHLRFLLRELVQARRQAAVFVLCVALSLFSMVALNSFRNTVQGVVLGDARSLQGGDILIHSHYPWSPALAQAAAGLEQDGKVRAVRMYECYSVIRPTAGDRTLLTRLKIAEPGYPLYGKVTLQSGRPLETVLTAGNVVAEREVLERLGLKVGDQVHIGNAVLTIADIITHEPDRPVELFSLGPRILIPAANLDQLQLIGKSSRVDYGILLKVQRQEDIKTIAAELAKRADPDQEQVATALSTRPQVKVFFDNLFFFLSLISLFTLLLAGIGMQTSLAALLRERRKTLAIIKSLGAPGGFLFLNYFALILALGLLGSLAGIAFGCLLEHYLPVLFAGILPAGTTPVFTLADAAQGLLLGLLAVIFFTFLPLYGLRQIRPMALFRNDVQTGARGIFFYLAALAGLFLLTLFTVRQLQDIQIGLCFIAASLALLFGIWLLTRLLLAVSGRFRLPFLELRQAHKSLFRPGNATCSIIVTLACALSVLLTIYQIQTNLAATYIESYPPEAPNLFFLDIQPKQKEDFIRKAGHDMQLFPIIRARLVSINGQPVRERQQPQQRGDSLTREFNLTYRNALLEDEVLTEGASLFRKDPAGASIPLQVSVLDTVAEMGNMHRGDRLAFNIQGIPLEATISSIRTRTKSRLYPFFYFVFPEEFLRDAPQTFFAALHLEPQEIAGLENRIASGFPNISFINMTQTAAELGGLARRLTGIVNFFAGFSILAGILILIGSILATRLARIREAVYYTILGAGSRFVLSVFIYEHLLLGLFSSISAVILAQSASWALCRYLFAIRYSPSWPVSILLILLTGLLVVAIGLLSSAGIFRQKPAIALREQYDE